MLGNRTIDRICAGAMAVMLLLTGLVWAGKASAGRQTSVEMGYESFFDTSYVHVVDIALDDWEGFLETASSEEYTVCDVTLDGEKIAGVAIRAKGNTSLSSVASMGSSKYSFKIEFDRYTDGKTYHGLDKLSLNNLIYDATMMKDYLAYILMARGRPVSALLLHGAACERRILGAVPGGRSRRGQLPGAQQHDYGRAVQAGQHELRRRARQRP